MNDFTREFTAAREVGQPLVYITTIDQNATAEFLRELVADRWPIVQWDIIRGAVGANPRGQAALRDLLEPDEDPAMVTTRPVDLLARLVPRAGIARRLAPGTLVLMQNMHLYLSARGDDAAALSQAIRNVRDPFKQNAQMLVLLGADVSLPVELQPDILLLDDPPPDDATLRTIVDQAVTDAERAWPELVIPDAPTRAKAVEALRGLSAFTAETGALMAMQQARALDLPILWTRKHRAIEQVKGITVMRGTTGYEGIGGRQQFTDFMRMHMAGEDPPELIVFLDEIEKTGMAERPGGEGSDVGADARAVFLKAMQTYGWDGVVFLGMGGTGKSQLCQTTVAEFGLQGLEVDLNAARGKYVGESEAGVRAIIRTILAIGRGRVFFMAACNGATLLAPEIKRRFRSGLWFCDIPEEGAEKRAIWAVHLARHGLPPWDAIPVEERPDDRDWTGADIETCCDKARRYRRPLRAVAGLITPIARTDAAKLALLRTMAHDRWLSTTQPGFYKYPGAPSQDLVEAVNDIGRGRRLPGADGLSRA